MSKSLPKELIALARGANWSAVRDFITQFMRLTLKPELPYDITVIRDADESTKGESVIEYQISKASDLNKLDTLEDFNTLSIYQFNQYYENNLYLTKNEGTIIFFAKYMSPITEKLNLNCFEFIILLDSISNPVFLSNAGDKLNYERIIDLFKNIKSRKPIKDIRETGDEVVEAFIFEHVTGRNAVWGDSETKAFQTWKERTADLFQSETGNYSHYGGSLTRKYRDFLETMFAYWQILSNNGERPIEVESLHFFLKFLKG